MLSNECKTFFPYFKALETNSAYVAFCSHRSENMIHEHSVYVALCSHSSENMIHEQWQATAKSVGIVGISKLLSNIMRLFAF